MLLFVCFQLCLTVNDTLILDPIHREVALITHFQQVAPQHKSAAAAASVCRQPTCCFQEPLWMTKLRQNSRKKTFNILVHFYLLLKKLVLNVNRFVAMLLRGHGTFSSPEGRHDRKSLRTTASAGVELGLPGWKIGILTEVLNSPHWSHPYETYTQYTALYIVTPLWFEADFGCTWTKSWD